MGFRLRPYAGWMAFDRKERLMIRTSLLRAVAALGLALGVAACEAPPAAQEAAAVPGTLPTVDMEAARAAAMGAVPLQVLEFNLRGTRSLTSRIRGDTAPAYAVPVAAGQTLTVDFRSSNHAATFNLMDTANPAEAVHRGSVEGNIVAVKPARDTTYVIVPFTERAIARRGTVATFTLTVTRE
jgi:hypothetical protein